MSIRFFGRDKKHQPLGALYRALEQAGEPRNVEPEALREFAADQQLVEQIRQLSLRSAPESAAAARSAFLSSVASQKLMPLEEETRPMIGRLLSARGFALVAVAGIFVGGAATVGASGGVGGAADHANSALSALHLSPKGHGHGVENEADASATPGAESTRRAVVGIPTDNPQHQPEADGTCVKGETVVKTVPSGVAVNVPCQAVEQHGQGDEHKNSNANKTHVADETPETNETPEATESPEAEGTEANEHADERGEHTPVPLPTEANAHATEHAGGESEHD